MRVIIILISFLLFSGCEPTYYAVVNEPKLIAEANIERNKLIEENQGYEYCADQGKYFHGVKLTKKDVSFMPLLLFKTSEMRYTGDAEISCQDDEKWGFDKTRLADEIDGKVKNLDTDFMCIQLYDREALKYDTTYLSTAYENELNARNIKIEEECNLIFADYEFSLNVAKKEKRCSQMGFSVNTPEMSNCVLQLIASETQTNQNTTTTVVVNGSSSNDAIADELRKMNKRGNAEYYEKMMRTGYDMMTCYTWPNC